MYNKTIENILPDAISAVEFYRESMEEDGRIKSKYNGYLASFGPSVIMAGLRQTVLFYDNSKKANDHGIINKIIYHTLDLQNWSDGAGSLKQYVNEYDKLKKKRVLDVVIACKIAIRTFDLEE